MNEAVDRLQDLLTRVQQNRAAPRASTAKPAQPTTEMSTKQLSALRDEMSAKAAQPSPPQSVGASAPKPAAQKPAAPVMAAPASAHQSRGTVSEERVSLPQNRPAAAKPAPAREPARDPVQRERLSTPLQLAVEDEVNRTPSEPPTAQLANSRPARPQAQANAGRAPEPSFQEPDEFGFGDAASAPIPSKFGEAPSGPSQSYEPEPVREGNRPIAQVVSKHAAEVDATFGAMLRRSLSLRPR